MEATDRFKPGDIVIITKRTCNCDGCRAYIGRVAVFNRQTARFPWAEVSTNKHRNLIAMCK